MSPDCRHTMNRCLLLVGLVIVLLAPAALSRAQNTAPTGAADSYTVERKAALAVAAPGVLANDSDPESDPLSASLYGPPANGVLSLNADGSLSYANQGALDFNAFTFTSYSNQDTTGSVTIEDGGATVHLVGNTWKKIALPAVLTSDTILEFDFQSSILGELHSIGFDSDNAHGPTYLIELYGTETYGIQDFHDYSGAAWKHYRIPVGLLYQGDMLYLCFANDHDVATPTAASRFRNVRIYREGAKWDAFWYQPFDGLAYGEATTATIEVTPPELGGLIDFNAYAITSYDNQDMAGSATIEDNGATLKLKGNVWKKIAFPFAVTPNTVIEFDFQSSIRGEIQGLGLDNDNLLSAGYLFQINGTQIYGNQRYHDYASTTWKHYKVFAGTYYTGNMLYLFFANDHDMFFPNAECRFRHVRVYDSAATANFATSLITTFASGQDAGTAAREYLDTRVVLNGDAWKKIAFPYTITSNTVVEFDFESGVQGEIQGFTFSSDNMYERGRVFQLYGTQTYGIQDYRDYNVKWWKHYTIPVGKYYVGRMLYLGLINDQDTSPATAQCRFRSIRVYEAGVNVDFDEVAMSAHNGQDIAGTATIEDEGAVLHLAGNTWRKFALPYTVSPNTILDFDFQAATGGEIQGVQFDNDNNFSPSFVFQLAGTQLYGYQDYHNYSGTDWAHYTIPVGEHYTGAMVYLSFLNDEDTTFPAVDGRFRNVRILEQRPLTGALDFRTYAVLSFDDQDLVGGAVVEDSGATLHLAGNTWKRIALPYVVTPNTVIEIDFQAPVLAQIHCIGFDNNNKLAPDYFFELYGTETYGFQDYRTYSGTDWQHFTIPVGQFYTGPMLYLVFMNDDDDGTPTGESRFRNVLVYEQ